MAASVAGEKKQASVGWWIGWILLTIGSFFVSCYFWTRFIAKHMGPMSRAGVPILWVTTVFGSWMMMLLPLIVVMYRKVDKAYEDARLAREKAQGEKTRNRLRVRSIFIEDSLRRLPRELTEKLKTVPETIHQGHLVTAILRNGEKVENVFILNKKQVLGVYDAEQLSFNVNEIADLEPVDTEKLPHFETGRWLRLDGVGSQ